MYNFCAVLLILDRYAHHCFGSFETNCCCELLLLNLFLRDVILLPVCVCVCER